MQLNDCVDLLFQERCESFTVQVIQYRPVTHLAGGRGGGSGCDGSLPTQHQKKRQKCGRGPSRPQRLDALREWLLFLIRSSICKGHLRIANTAISSNSNTPSFLSPFDLDLSTLVLSLPKRVPIFLATTRRLAALALLLASFYLSRLSCPFRFSISSVFLSPLSRA
ncbi:hypothetical protein CH063_02977 [Colletotrichum higginsianum]|uniref:Uncharacterized protein n=1 Tax=Colletotrichum higginsianum (strain IMI 349063) TaxID=759273 RepID=H1VS30_COLHI|nr:hypothetical protein CH63R_01025 [Colletotrichum higginsianum IMI 349063]OBR15845.1 hypothetical protein CH63R_01025 [Colletotrichum higginsianum IMI 349063]CCF43037.1 hypothetical protein CH063_02977 [Colletotrichum higginsianum]